MFKKKLLSALLVFFLLFSIVPVSAVITQPKSTWELGERVLFTERQNIEVSCNELRWEMVFSLFQGQPFNDFIFEDEWQNKPPHVANFPIFIDTDTGSKNLGLYEGQSIWWCDGQVLAFSTFSFNVVPEGSGNGGGGGDDNTLLLLGLVVAVIGVYLLLRKKGKK